MRIIKKIVTNVLICLLLCIFVKPVFAEFNNTKIIVNFDTSEITASGNFSQYNGEIINLTIFYPTEAGLDMGNVKFTATESGDFSQAISADSSFESGYYTALLETDAGVAISQTFLYMSKSDIIALINQINSCTNSSEIEQIIERNADLFNTSTIVNKQTVYNSLVGKSFSSFQEINIALADAVLLAQINEAHSVQELQELVTNLFEMPSDYNNIQNKTAVYEYLFGKTFISLDAVNAELHNSILLAQINESSNPQQLEQLILSNNNLLQADFSKYYNISNTVYRLEVWKRLLFKSYQSLIDFKYSFNDVCTEMYKTSMPPVSSGGGSSSSSSPVSIQNISLIEGDSSSQLSFQATSNSSDISNINIYVALYNTNGKLNRLKRIAHEIAPGERCFVDMEYLKKNPEDKCNYKIMVWDDTMCPLSGVKTNIVQ